MYGDLLLDRLGVKFLDPAPLHLELLHMLTTLHWNALGSLGGGFAFLVGGLAGASRFLGTHFPSGMSLVKYNLFFGRSQARHITFCPTVCMPCTVRCIQTTTGRVIIGECKGCKWYCPTTQPPTQQHNEPQRKILG